MTFLYEADMAGLQAQCPPKDYKPVTIRAYRWVYEDINHPDNFKPAYHRNPKRFIEKTDATKCMSMALSLFDSAENAQKRFAFFKKTQGKLVHRLFGTHIAVETIQETDGVNSAIDMRGHFSHHPVTECQYDKRFSIVETLT